MISLLITILVAILIFGLIFWLINMLPLDPNVKRIIQVIVIIIGILILLSYTGVLSGHTWVR